MTNDLDTIFFVVKCLFVVLVAVLAFAYWVKYQAERAAKTPSTRKLHPELQAMKDLADAGFTAEEIAEKLNKPVSTVRALERFYKAQQ